jgi:hypothetical protein
MTLRLALAALSDQHQRLLVEAAFHALNDVQFSAEVADLAGVDHESLAGENGFACQVVAQLFDAARAESESTAARHLFAGDELARPGPSSQTLPMGTKVFTVTQGPEDFERLRKVYGPAPLLPGKTV